MVKVFRHLVIYVKCPQYPSNKKIMNLLKTNCFVIVNTVKRKVKS